MRHLAIMTGLGVAALSLAACNDQGKMETGAPVANGTSASAALMTATGVGSETWNRVPTGIVPSSRRR